jgi:hypothetical protein
MEASAALKILAVIAQGFALGEKLVPLFDRVKKLYEDYQNPDRPDVTLASFDAELEAMRKRSAEIQNSGT